MFIIYGIIDYFLNSSLSGKTYTMVGTQDDPGLMVLSLNTIFDLMKKDSSSDDFEVTCSYLEVYNEVGHSFIFYEKIILIRSSTNMMTLKLLVHIGHFSLRK